MEALAALFVLGSLVCLALAPIALVVAIRLSGRVRRLEAELRRLQAAKPAEEKISAPRAEEKSSPPHSNAERATAEPEAAGGGPRSDAAPTPSPMPPPVPTRTRPAEAPASARAASAVPRTDDFVEALEAPAGERRAVRAVSTPAPRDAAAAAEVGGGVAPRPAVERGPREADFGVRALAWAGALFTLAGLAFFLKYAYDNEWIGPRGRLIGGSLAALFAVVLGHLPRFSAHRVFCDALAGLGFSGLYVCAWYGGPGTEILGTGLALAAAHGVTAAALASALLRNRPTLGILGVVGGYAAPVFISPGPTEGLFFYLFVLLVGGAGVAAHLVRRWHGIRAVAWTGAAALVVLRLSAPGIEDPAALVAAFSWVGLALVYLGVLPPLLGGGRREDPEGVFLVSVAGFAQALLLHRILEDTALALNLGLGALALAATAWFCSRRESGRLLVRPVLVQSLLLASLVPPAALSAEALGLAWALEAAALVLLCERGGAGRLVFRCFAGLAGIAATFAALVGRPLEAAELTGLLDGDVIGHLGVGVALLFASSRLRKLLGREAGDALGFAVAGGLVAVLTLQVGCRASFSEAATHALADAATWSLLGLFYGAWMLAERRPVLAVPGALALLGGLAAWVHGLGPWERDPAGWEPGPRLLAGFAVAGASLALGLLCRRSSALADATPAWTLPRRLSPALSGLGVLMIGATLHAEVAGRFAALDGALAADLAARLLVWTALGAGGIAYARLNGLRIWLVLASGLLLVGAGVLADGLARTPLESGALMLSAPFLSRAAYVVVGSVLAASIRALDLGSGPRIAARVGEVLLQVVLLVSISAEILRWSETSGATLPFVGAVDQELGRGLLSAAWAVQALGLIWWGLVTRARVFRVMGLTLFGLTIAKALLIDLGDLPTVHRILSFVGSGLLLLAGSYAYSRGAARIMKENS